MTQHFGDLKGLRFGPPWLSVMLLPLFMGRDTSPRQIALIVVLIAAFTTAWYICSGGWYDKHYGSVSNESLSLDLAPGFRWAAFALLGYMVRIGIFGDVGHYPRYSPWLCCLVAILPKCFYPVSNSWPIRLRRLFYIAGALTLLAMAVSARFMQLHPSSYTIVLSSLSLLLGFYDHWLLKHLLHGENQGARS